ncbi:MAG: hypothetical protein D6815_09975 [Candidatus Dadabacteria bacterium]|nr:MAG: hypothetical protein D6815_09975 [Candidatus Dadabacteria bacterium]
MCDPTADDRITATDALACLQKAVGLPVALRCPCPASTTTTSTTTTTTTTTVPASTTSTTLAGLCGDGTVNAPAEQCDGPDDSACPGACRNDCTCPQKMPVLTVTGSGPTQQQADALAQAFGLGQTWPWPIENGVIQYVDANRFLVLPTIDGGDGPPDENGNPTHITKLDFGAIQNLPVYPEADAIQKVTQALEAAGLAVAEGTPSASHTVFDAVSTDGTPVVDAKPIDTVVTYTFSVNGVPVEGPGAKIRAAFDGQGNLTQFYYAWRQVTPGNEVEVVPPGQALAAWRASPGAAKAVAGPAVGVTDQMDLVYYAPEPEIQPSELLPHYRNRGSLTLDGGTVDVREVYIPAFVARLQVTITDARFERMAEEFGTWWEVVASASVSNGRPPYHYSWHSSTVDLHGMWYDVPTIHYQPNPYVRAGEVATHERISVTVTDADGQTVTSERVELPFPPEWPPGGIIPVGGNDFGAEWYGECSPKPLPGTIDNAWGFVHAMEDKGYRRKFALGEEWSWEVDFKDDDFEGIDYMVADDVDFAFYTGHAGPNSFLLCGNVQDRRLKYSDAIWGEDDLEWIVIAACGPLQSYSWHNWESAFDGLHLIMAYGSTSADTDKEGSELVRWSHPQRLGGIFDLPAFSLHTAWALTAINAQPDGRIWAVMGVFGTSGESSYDDYIWGQGPVSPDLRGSTGPFAIGGYWHVSGPT